MSKWVPPIDDELHDLGYPEEGWNSAQAYYDWVIQEYGSIVTKLTELTALKYKLRDLMDSYAQPPDKVTGTVTLDGDKLRAKIVRGLRGKYPAVDADEQPFLQTIFEEMEGLRPAISIKFEEKTAAMTKLLDALSQDITLSTEEKELLGTVTRRRELVKAAASVKVEVK
jgi:hypothetical protein